jgi:hypothetical protein
MNLLDNFFNGKKSQVKQIILYPNQNQNQLPQILKLVNNPNFNHQQQQQQLQLNHFDHHQLPPSVPIHVPVPTPTMIPMIDPNIGLENSIILQFVNTLKNKGIKVACFDFDDTIVDVNYNNEFDDPVNISKRVCSLFLKLARYLIENRIFVTITTFNGNPLISEALSKTCGYKIPVFFRQDHTIGTGKMWHIQQSLNYAHNKMKLNPLTGNGLQTSNVILFDDNPDNQIIARTMGCNVVDNQHVITLDDLLKFIQSSSS